MKLLVCGTRKKLSDAGKSDVKKQIKNTILSMGVDTIIEGCCPGSPDEIAEQVAKEENIKIIHFPATTGTYLKRNHEMVASCDIVIAFWDGYSYGTAQAVASAVMAGKKVRVYGFSGGKT